MKIDFSKILFDRYFALENREIEISLKSGVLLKGKIVGFFRGEGYPCDYYIRCWRISTGNKFALQDLELFGLHGTVLIETGEISEVKILQNNTTIKFE